MRSGYLGVADIVVVVVRPIDETALHCVWLLAVVDDALGMTCTVVIATLACPSDWCCPQNCGPVPKVDVPSPCFDSMPCWTGVSPDGHGNADANAEVG